MNLLLEKGAEEIPDTYFTTMNHSIPEIGPAKPSVTVCTKRCACVLILLAMMTAAAGAACIVLLFLEVAALKSELSMMQEVSSGEVITNNSTAVLEELNNRILNLEQHFLWLNDSLSSLLNEGQDCELDCELVSQLNESVVDLYWMLEQKMLLLNEYTGLPSCAALPPSFPPGYYWVRASNGSAVREYCGTSCAALPPSFPSGYYWVRASNGTSVRVYCDVSRSCGGVTGGRTRLAYLDMTNNAHQCPSGLRERTDSGLRTCGINLSGAGCSSVTFAVTNSSFSQMCGRIKAYQVGSLDTFGLTGNFFPQGRTQDVSIDGNYVDGISLTVGSPRTHIWSFAAGLDEVGTFPHFNCPCTNVNQASSAKSPPTFVGNDYFCDTGSEGRYNSGTFYSDDPLWDGSGCGPLNSCCDLNNPPWFYRHLSPSASGDIEMRVCRDELSNNEDVAIEVIELYIQ